MIRIWCLFDVHLPWASLSSSLVRGPIPNVPSAASHLHCEFHHICQYFAHRAIKKYEEYTVHTLHTRCHNVSYTYVHSFAAHLTVNEGSRVSVVAPWLLAFYIEVGNWCNAMASHAWSLCVWRVFLRDRDRMCPAPVGRTLKWSGNATLWETQE